MPDLDQFSGLESSQGLSCFGVAKAGQDTLGASFSGNLLGLLTSGVGHAVGELHVGSVILLGDVIVPAKRPLVRGESRGVLSTVQGRCG